MPDKKATLTAYEELQRQYDKMLITEDELVAKLLDLRTRENHWRVVEKANGFIEAANFIKKNSTAPLMLDVITELYNEANRILIKGDE